MISTRTPVAGHCDSLPVMAKTVVYGPDRLFGVLLGGNTECVSRWLHC